MKHWLITLCCGCSFSLALSAQQLAPDVLASNGGIGLAAGIQIDWTLGESSIGSITGQEKSYTEGFHQPLLLLQKVDFAHPVMNRLEKPVPESGINITPNPVSSELTIHFNGIKTEVYDCQVFDANGNPHLRQTLRTNEGNAKMNVTSLLPGLFFIRFISAKDGAITVFKLSKIK
jgi:hypothetical protein